MFDHLVSFIIPTDNHISIISSKIIKNTKYYISVLTDHSTLNIKFKTNKEENEKEEKEEIIVDLKTLLDHMRIEDNPEKVKAFETLYDEEFHSSDFNIFKLIEETFELAYGISIFQTENYKKFNYLKNKLDLAKQQIASFNKTLSEKEYNDLLNFFEKDPISLCNQTEFKIDELVLKYRKNNIPSSPPITNTITSVSCVSLPMVPQKMILKKKFSKYVHEETNMVYDIRNKKFIGFINEKGEMFDLTFSLMNYCKTKGWNY
jgi:hypothetical protein